MHRVSVLTLSLLSGFFATFAHAGAPPPCVRATLSASRNILVLSDFTTEKEGAEEKVKTSTLRILRRHDEINTATRLDGPDTYWTWSVPLWSVDFTWTMPGFITCPYTLVTDDGEYLILFHNRFDFHTALSIYRRCDHPGQPRGGTGPDHGILIRDLPLSEIWAEHMPLETMITDHTPQWYAGGTFAFSPDNKTLIHKTTWSQTVRIDLATGKITRE
jgi:hypothetical protein